MGGGGGGGGENMNGCAATRLTSGVLDTSPPALDGCDTKFSSSTSTCSRKLFICGSRPILVLTTVLGCSRRTDAKNVVKTNFLLNLVSSRTPIRGDLLPEKILQL